MLIPLTFFSLIFSNFLQATSIPATTEDGVNVLLYPDGRWAYKQHAVELERSAQALNKPGSADYLVRGRTGMYGIWVDQEKWAVSPRQYSDASDLSFYHEDRNAFALVIYEAMQIPKETLQEGVLENARAIDPDAKVMWAEERTVNGVDLLALKMEFSIEDVPFVYYGYYYVGDIGTVQVITYTGKAMFAEYEKDFSDFLNGFVVFP